MEERKKVEEKPVKRFQSSSEFKIFIPAIILIPFLGLAGFIAGATLGTIFAVIAGFIPYWALAVIVLLIIALILRGKSFSKED